MTYKLTHVYGGYLVLECTIDHYETDKFSPMTGHYTEQGDAFVESIEHNGQDISEIVDESVFADILNQYINEIKGE